MKKLSVVSVFLLSVIFVAWLILKDNAGNNQNLDVIKVKAGYLAIAGALPVFVADQEGYFRDQGIEVELIQFRSSNEIAIAAVNDQIDFVALGATNAVLDAGSVSGTEFLAFQLNGYTEGEKPTDYLLAREGVDINNLKGKKVAFFPGSISKAFGNIVFPKYNLNLDDFEYVEMAPPNWQSALVSGAIDAVTAIEPFATQIIEDGVAFPIISGYYAKVMPDVPLSAAWFVKGRLTQSVEKKLVAAYAQALDMISLNPDNAVKHYQAYTKIRPELFTRIGLNKWRLVTDDEAKQSMIDFVDLLLKEKEIKEVYGEIVWKRNLDD